MNGLDWLAQAFSSFVADVRERVVEEPWFGRGLDEGASPSAPAQQAGADLGWVDWKSRDHEPTPPSHEPGLGHDR